MDLFLSIVAQIVRIAVPYGLVAVGGCLSERSGVINIALEGILLNSAFGTAVGTISTGSAEIGVCCGILAGALTALLHSLAMRVSFLLRSLYYLYTCVRLHMVFFLQVTIHTCLHRRSHSRYLGYVSSQPQSQTNPNPVPTANALATVTPSSQR